MSILQVVQLLDLLEKANWQPDEFEAEWHTFPPSGSPDEKVCEICQSMNGTSYMRIETANTARRNLPRCGWNKSTPLTPEPTSQKKTRRRVKS